MKDSTLGFDQVDQFLVEQVAEMRVEVGVEVNLGLVLLVAEARFAGDLIGGHRSEVLWLACRVEASLDRLENHNPWIGARLGGLCHFPQLSHRSGWKVGGSVAQRTLYADPTPVGTIEYYP